MPLTRPFGIDQAYANASDWRKQNAAIFPKEGVLPDPVTVAAAGIAYPNGGWNVGARIFTAVARRNSAPFSQAYGAALISNDSQANAWAIPAAPATGSRIDILWFKATDPTQGDATTTPSGETVPRAVPIFGVTSGSAATTPVAPTLPSGVVEVARVTTASTATSIANSVFTHSYAFAYVLGGPAYFRTESALLAATTGWVQGQLGYAIDTNRYFMWNNGWGDIAAPRVAVFATFAAGVPDSETAAGNTTLGTSINNDFATGLGSGQISLLKNGVYSLDYLSAMGVAAPNTGRSGYVQIESPAGSRLSRNSVGPGEDTVSTHATVVVTSAPQTVRLWLQKAGGGTPNVNGLATIVKIG